MVPAVKPGGEYACGSPGTEAKSFLRESCASGVCIPLKSELSQWPVKLRHAPASASYYYNADLLVAADCCAYACASFHREFIRGRVLLIGCPETDTESGVGKLTEILRNNDIRSLTVVRMEEPCCAAFEGAVKRAVQAGGRVVPCRTVTISADGRVSE